MGIVFMLKTKNLRKAPKGSFMGGVKAILGKKRRKTIRKRTKNKY